MIGRVPITIDNIFDGQCGSPTDCAIADAMWHNGYKNPVISDMGIWIDNVWYDAAPEVGEWVNWYDEHGPGDPEVTEEVMLIDEEARFIWFEKGEAR